MRLVKLDGGKIGLFVVLPNGPHVIDIAGSLGVFVPHDPLSNGLLNGALKDGCNWSLLVKHWAHLRSPLRKLAVVAIANPHNPRLVLKPMTDDLGSGDASDPIVAIDITDIETIKVCDPTSRCTLERRFMSPSDSGTPKKTTAGGAQVIVLSSLIKRTNPPK